MAGIEVVTSGLSMRMRVGCEVKAVVVVRSFDHRSSLSDWGLKCLGLGAQSRDRPGGPTAANHSG